MFDQVEIALQKAEIDKAKESRNMKGCLRSLCRRNIPTLANMKPSARVEWLKMLGLKQTNITEILSVIAEFNYDLSRM